MKKQYIRSVFLLISCYLVGTMWAMNNGVSRKEAFNAAKKEAFNAAKKDDITTVNNFLNAHPDNIKIKYRCQHGLLSIAAAHGSVVVCELLVGKGADINEENMLGYTPLHYWVQQQGNRLAAYWLLDWKKADINKQSEFDKSSPLHLAVECGNTVAVKALLDRDANPNLKDWRKQTPLQRAQEMHNRAKREREAYEARKYTEIIELLSPENQ